jgi:chorismate--pyruvate lyase
MPECNAGVIADRQARRFTVWRPVTTRPPQSLPPRTRASLLDTGSLTARLKARCGPAFHVELLALQDITLDHDLSRLLGLPRGAPAQVREVHLCGAQCRLVFAQSVLPYQSLQGRWRRLLRLGTKPLGQVLFSDRRVRRGELQIACLQPGMRLYQRASAGLDAPPAQLWGRRSLFELPRGPVLVCEFFLPTFEQGDEYE